MVSCFESKRLDLRSPLNTCDLYQNNCIRIVLNPVLQLEAKTKKLTKPESHEHAQTCIMYIQISHTKM